MNQAWKPGANYEGDGRCAFEVWAPNAREVTLHLLAPRERRLPMTRVEAGYFRLRVPDVFPGARYLFQLDGKDERPDPASRFQPEGVHSASEVVDPAFAWTDAGWSGLPLRDYVIYELHVGTFTSEGTFESIIPHLQELAELGITALELMPVAQFPGARNWGYDGVYPYAVQNSYGGPNGLKRLVNACHEVGLAIVLDVVYNHLGPEGNYFSVYGKYFNDLYRTPWGSALNFDAAHSDEVRRFFLENALHWQTDFHVDGLRLDAMHAIRDFSAVPFLQDLARVTHRRSERLNRRFHLMAESDLNDPRIIQPEVVGGYGLDAQWSDDFHHVLHVLLTGEKEGYYADFGGVRQLAKVFEEGYAYTGQHSVFRKHRHGAKPINVSARQFVVFAQNHDQVGNRFRGDRLSCLVGFEGLKLAAGCVLLSPFTPLLFMGEEYGEPGPFQYVISHTDPELVEAVRRGRREEFAGFFSGDDAPDPFAEATFQDCVLRRNLGRDHGTPHQVLHAFYRELIRLRKTVPSLVHSDTGTFEVQAREAEQGLLVHYHAAGDEALCILSFAPERVPIPFDYPAGEWRLLLNSAAPCWGTKHPLDVPELVRFPTPSPLTLAPQSIVVFQKVVNGVSI